MSSRKAPRAVVPAEERSGFRTLVESTGLQKPENLLSFSPKDARAAIQRMW